MSLSVDVISERHDRSVEVLDVLGLDLNPASGVGFLLFGEAFGRSLGFEVGTNALNRRCRRPDVPGEEQRRRRVWLHD